MLQAISLTCLVLLSGALGCVADVASTETGAYGPTPTEQTAKGQSFEVQLPRDVTMESVVPAIVAAGHAQLAVACASTPDASIRIMHPLASGSFEDVSCASIPSGDESTGETSAALSSAEHLGQVQQKGVISTVACFAGAAATFLVPRYGICPHGTTERIRTNCNDAGGWGSLGIGLVCTLTVILPF
jgi:hypothetical protein